MRLAPRSASAQHGYEGRYVCVYPIKVNQSRVVVDEIVEVGKQFHYGLEAGSKPELLAVMALHQDEKALVVCNGYKDEEFMRLALMGQKLGHKVFIVIEQLSEIDVLLEADGPRVTTDLQAGLELLPAPRA